MFHEITVEGLGRLTNPVFVDVRSESEFAEATIPGAVNLPLFSDLERAEVGVVYKQISHAAAKDLGLSLASPKLPEIVRRCRELEKSGQLVFFCWRGGMRSKAIVSILDLMGISGFRLEGGYKAFRRSVVRFWEQEPFPYRIVVIRGNTGTGKTQLIKALQQRGRPAVDLEKLANNRGSVFGAVGLGGGPSQKNFEAALTQEFLAFRSAKWFVVECESKRIGRVTLPNVLHKAMQEGKQVLVYDSVENRVQRLVQDYTTFVNVGNELEGALNRLRERLGSKRIDMLKCWLRAGDYANFARLLLEEYYDPLYGYPNEAHAGYSLSVSMENPVKALEIIEAFLDSLEGSGGTFIP